MCQTLTVKKLQMMMELMILRYYVLDASYISINIYLLVAKVEYWSNSDFNYTKKKNMLIVTVNNMGLQYNELTV